MKDWVWQVRRRRDMKEQVWGGRRRRAYKEREVAGEEGEKVRVRV